MTKLPEQQVNKMTQSESNLSTVQHEGVLEQITEAALDSVLRNGSNCLDRMSRLNDSLCQLRLICEVGRAADPQSLRAFENLKSQCLEIINTDATDGALHNRDYNFELPPAQLAQTPVNQRYVALTLPDLTSYKSGVLTNMNSLRGLDHSLFHSRLQESQQFRLHSQATIQGVRISARFPHDASRIPCHAVNSLSALTGVSAVVVGNAVFSGRPARDVAMPLSKGDIEVGGTPVEGSSGQVMDLIEQINSGTADHKIRAALLSDGNLVLESVDGVAINIVVKSQAASLVSGFPMGSKSVPAQSRGVLAWFAENEEQLRFDSEKTSLALNGQSSAQLSLERFGLTDLNCEDATLSQLSYAVIDRLCRLLSVQQLRLTQQLKELIDSLGNCAEESLSACKDSLALLESRLQVCESACPS